MPVPSLAKLHPVGVPTRRVDPIMPKRTRSREPTPFAGLTHKPPCALCEQAAGESAPVPPPSRRARCPQRTAASRTVDTSLHFRPHPECDYRGWRGLGESAGQRPSQWRPVAAVSLPRLQRLFSRASRHHLSWQAGGGGADRPLCGVPGPSAPRQLSSEVVVSFRQKLYVKHTM